MNTRSRPLSEAATAEAGNAGRLGRSPVLRAALLGISASLVGFTVIAAYTAWQTQIFTSMFIADAGVAVIVVPLWWGVRGLRFRHSATQPGRTMVADARIGRRIERTGLTHPTTWLMLREIGNPVPYGWQRVMWHPAVEETPENVRVMVRGKPARPGPTGPLVIELPGGVRLVPVGRVRRTPPKGYELTSRPGVHVELGSDGRPVVLRDDSPLPPHWWRRAPLLVLVGILAGGALGFAVGGAVTVLPGSVLLATLFLDGWTLTGGEP
ncbi:hypothetical protein [Parafrankia sp. FMc2]|uniref:hypothetical protein n=1 Tax=Parafrankia sp. FMc2 TaxID=3233196 RepID=UPI0034D7510B